MTSATAPGASPATMESNPCESEQPRLFRDLLLHPRLANDRFPPAHGGSGDAAFRPALMTRRWEMPGSSAGALFLLSALVLDILLAVVVKLDKRVVAIPFPVLRGDRSP
jgi:hypothetical protein